MSSRQLFDDTDNDSDKSFTVGSGQRYRVFYGQVTLITTATVGNRQMALEVQDDSANLIYRTLAGAVQTASLTREYHFSPNTVREAAFINTQILVPIPPQLILLPGWVLRFYDTAAIDAAADDMTVSILIEDRAMNRYDPDQG